MKIKLCVLVALVYLFPVISTAKSVSKLPYLKK